MEIVLVDKERFSLLPKIVDLYKQHYGEGYSLKEYLSVDSLEDLISKEKVNFFAAVENSELFGTMASEYNYESNTFEVGRLVFVLNANNNSRHIFELSDNLIKEGFRRGMDFLWCSARTKSIDKAGEIKYTFIGYTSRHKVCEVRENHTLYARLNPYSAGKFTLPKDYEDNIIYNASFVKKFLKEYSTLYNQGTYPEKIFCGENMSEKTIDHTTIYFKDRSSDAYTLLKPKDTTGTLSTILTDENLEKAFPESSCFDIEILSDKTEYLKILSSIGFNPSAFIPGGFYDKRSGLRYDTVRMTKLLKDQPISQDTIIESKVKLVNDAFRM